VALLDPSDGSRAGCLAALDRLEGATLVTTEAVVTETEYLLDFSSKAQVALMQLLSDGRPRVEPIAASERLRLGELMSRYRTLPMDYADATLVLLAERLNTTRVFTLDRRDFGLYRVGKRRFEIMP
jgi:predicted nucleic acid-binding protein